MTVTPGCPDHGGRRCQRTSARREQGRLAPLVATGFAVAVRAGCWCVPTPHEAAPSWEVRATWAGAHQRRPWDLQKRDVQGQTADRPRTRRAARIEEGHGFMEGLSMLDMPHMLAHLGPLGFFVAGGICSSVSHLLATPLDVIKTQQQADRSKAAFRGGKKGEKPLTVLQTAMKLIKEEGPTSLLKGAGPTFFGYFSHGALKYGLFEIWKGIFHVATAGGIARVVLLCLAAFLAELFATFVLCPAEAARIRLVTEPDYADRTLEGIARLRKTTGRFQNPLLAMKMWAALRKLKRTEGFKEGWFGALVPLLMKQCLYTVAKLVTYEELSEALTLRIWLWNPFLARAISALGAATAAAIASQPADTIFTCCSTDSGECPIPEDVEDIEMMEDEEDASIWRRMYQTAKVLGWNGLFMGWRARICQMAFIVMMQLLIYDAIRPNIRF